MRGLLSKPRNGVDIAHSRIQRWSQTSMRNDDGDDDDDDGDDDDDDNDQRIRARFVSNDGWG